MSSGSRPRFFSMPESGTELRETTYSTANDVFPMRVALETVAIGSWKYTSTDFEDLELLYELESSDLLINATVRGSNGGVPALYRIKNVSAADLSLVSVVPGSLDTMVARLVLETDQKVRLTSYLLEGKYNESESDYTQDRSEKIDIGIITMTASVHEAGHLRDILLFLKGNNCQSDVDPDSLFIRRNLSQENNRVKDKAGLSLPQLTFLEGLPHWVLYIPWMFYSKKVRYNLQKLIVIYTIFSVLWASWQLYRHVNIIHVIIRPVMDALRDYLSSVFDAFDWLFRVFTLWWHTFLSPLNVLGGLLLAPILRICLQFRSVMYPVYYFIYSLLHSAGLLPLLSSILSILYTLIRSTGTLFWIVLQVIVRPINCLWHVILNSRVAVASMDSNRLRLSWAFGLVTNSIKSIFTGLAKFVGYTHKERKIKQAIKASSTPVPSPVGTPSNLRQRRGDMPVMYSSPLTKT